MVLVVYHFVALKADIFILDEFQRYKQLLIDDATDATPAVELARAIFGMQGTKVLMLSATPFKAYTTDYDESKGEVHHEEDSQNWQCFPFWPLPK